MGKMTTRISFALVLTLGLTAAAPALAVLAAGHEALDYGFKFATAIETDPKGKGRTQTRILMAYLAKGYLDEALPLAEQVDGWWKGVALAEVAIRLAEADRPEEAKALVEKAQAFRDTIEGWQKTRVASHLAQALAKVGELEKALSLADQVAKADERQYTAQSAATVASAHATRGEFDYAMQQMTLLDNEDELMAAWWRTSGYLDLAQRESFSKEQRIKALTAAHDSAKGVPGWKQSEALRLVAIQLYELGSPKKAYEALETAEKMLGTPTAEKQRAPTQLAELARTWILVDKPKRARPLLAEAEKAVLTTTNIDQPGLYAQVAAGYAALGDSQDARRVLDKGFATAETLINARPRAMAIADICRWMGTEGLDPDDGARKRLDALYAGLGAPW